MSPTLLIAWREYKQYVFSRGFLLFLVLVPLLALFGGAALGVIEQTRPMRHYTIYDATGAYEQMIDKAMEERRVRETIANWDAWLALAVDRDIVEPEDIAPPFGAGAITHQRTNAFEAAGGVNAGLQQIARYLRPGAPPFIQARFQFQRLALAEDVAGAGSAEEATAFLKPYLNGVKEYPGAGANGLFAALVIPPDYTGAEGGPEAKFWSRNLTDPALEAALQRALESAVRRQASVAEGVPEDLLERLADVRAPMTAYRPDREDEDAELDQAERLQSAILPAGMTYMLLVIIFGVGNLLLTNTIEERSNKIVEVLLSSVTADQLMIGKLIGIAAVGLTMPAFFLSVGVFATAVDFSGGEFAKEAIGALLASNLVPVYIFYFLCAYVIFAMIFLAIGAMSNSLQDAQTFMGPVMMLVFLPMPFVVMVFQNPNGLVATILTWIPIYTPYAVMMRAASDPPLFEILGATAFMLVFAIFLARVMGRIFKNAILQSAPPKAKDIWRLASSKG